MEMAWHRKRSVTVSKEHMALRPKTRRPEGAAPCQTRAMPRFLTVPRKS